MPTPRDRHSDLEILRLTLVRELETINQYQDFFDAAEDPVVAELMEHLIFEEKEHVAELTEMLKRYDPDQLSHFEGEHAAEIAARVAGSGPGSVPVPAPVSASGTVMVPSPETVLLPSPVPETAPPSAAEIHAPPIRPRSAPGFTVGSLFGVAQP